jgi:hypothetical protein
MAWTGAAALSLVSVATAEAQTRSRSSEQSSSYEERRPAPQPRTDRDEDASIGGVLSPLRLDAEAKAPRARGWIDPLGGSTQRGRAGH